ncbi:MAG: chorismate synthase [Lachnospiraceae bacterium]|jgi:chorismate synthase|nr:chorismate synthase [Lachnospiraceae bacterium]
MAGSSFGTIFRITTWGESHGKALGVVIDGCPAGLELSENDITPYMNRRKPGQSRFSTPRKEDDSVEILSGIFEGKTTGTPISMIVYNTSQKSHDYSEIATYYRPGHADYTFDEKYGFRDYRGGGRSSGRETAARVAAGAVACKILAQLGITVSAYTTSIGDISIDYDNFDKEEIFNNNLYMPDKKAAELASQYLQDTSKAGDSAGGIIECVVTGAPSGLGDPVFEKLDANLAKAIMSIGAVKGVEIGDGFEVVHSNASKNNDAFVMKDGHVAKATNHAGGILGGISDGDMIILRAGFKPTPSIISTQQTVNKNHEEIDISVKGRHDPIIVPRAVVVVEAMTALSILDSLLINMTSKLDNIIKFYK